MPISSQDFRKKALTYWEAREIIDTPISQFMQQAPILTVNERFIRQLPYVTPTMEINPTTRQPRTQFEEIVYDEEDGAAGAGAIAIAMPGDVTQTYQLLGVFAAMDADGNAANRNFVIQIDQLPQILATQPAPTFSTTAIVITADQVGSLFMSEGSSQLWTNDNGVFAAVADENPCPCYLQGTSTVTATHDNPQVGDLVSVAVWYRRVI